jgi:hypothetical protein
VRKLLIVVALLLTGFILRPVVINTPVQTVTKSVAVHHWHGVDVETHVTMNPFYLSSINQWKIEVARRFPNAMILFCHGNTYDGQWCCFPEEGPVVPVRAMVQHLLAQNPDRVIVCIVCNPDGLKLGIPGVYHAKESVWIIPDKNFKGRTERSSADVGNIFEFVDD